MTTLPRGQDGPPSRLLIHADDPGQANRLALLVSHYGHQPRILDARQLLTPMEQGEALLVSCRQFGAEVRLGLSLWPDMPRLLFCERLGGDTQLALLQQGVLLVPTLRRAGAGGAVVAARPQPARHGADPDADRE